MTDKQAHQLLTIVQFIGEQFADGAREVYADALYGHDTISLKDAVFDILESLPVSTKGQE